jgi:hypothetical protein
VVVGLLLTSCRHGADRRLHDGKEAAIAVAIATLAVTLLLAMVVIDRLAR